MGLHDCSTCHVLQQVEYLKQLRTTLYVILDKAQSVIDCPNSAGEAMKCLHEISALASSSIIKDLNRYVQGS